MVVLKKNEGRLRKTFLDGPADLMVEVISPDSVERDRITKYNDYEAAGVKEYWLIETPDGQFSSPLLPGLVVEIDWLRAGQQPSLLDALRTMGIL